MKILVQRIFKGDEYTIGKMYIDGAKFCDTLEDKVRPYGEKVWGKTAIPAGTYKMVITWSERFKRKLPILLNVPMFEGIRIHGGNTAEHTHGCILLGVNDKKGEIHQSQFTLYQFMKVLTDSKQTEFEITVE